MSGARQNICLNMIVRNEAHVIRRCLDSVRPIIGSWVIVDTGSSDGTQNIIAAALADLPGELYERPWRNFGHNRSEALDLARGRGDYSFIIDADNVLRLEPGFAMPTLTADSYDGLVISQNLAYHRKNLLRSALPWRFEGVLHEYPTCAEAVTSEFLPGLTTIMYPDGARSRDPQKYRRDVEVLEQALRDDPDNARNVFYLAQSCRDAGDPQAAIRWYRRRTELGGWQEEIWYSLYQIGCIEARVADRWEAAMASFLAAWQTYPDRAEPLYQIAMHYQHRREHHIALLFLGEASKVPRPAMQRLFVEFPLYDHLIKIEYAVACYWTGRHAEAIAVNDALLTAGTLSAELIELVKKNRAFSIETIRARG